MSEGQTTHKKSRVFVIALATIGALSLFFFVFFIFIVTTLLIKGGVETVPVSSGDGIGILKIEGPISSPDKILNDLRKLIQNDDVKAIVVRIDSPGGAVGASQEIFKALSQADSQKPVVASLVNIAASGAFYAACGARYIVSNPGTVTGSIGVIMQLPNISGLLDKLGINYQRPYRRRTQGPEDSNG